MPDLLVWLPPAVRLFLGCYRLSPPVLITCLCVLAPAGPPPDSSDLQLVVIVDPLSREAQRLSQVGQRPVCAVLLVVAGISRLLLQCA
jgi:hypothetical protein